MTAEIIRDLPIGVYHSIPSDYVSHSRFHDFVKHGPAFFEKRYITGEIAREETEALRYGQAFEDLKQRGIEAFRETVAVRPPHLKGKGNTAPGKAWNDAHADKYCIDDATFAEMVAMCGALDECTDAVALFENAEQQVTLRGDAFGLKMQARPDILVLDHFKPIIGDIKTTKAIGDLLREVGPNRYEPGPAMLQFGYHSQLALMRRLLAEAGYPGASVYLWVAEKSGLNAACIEIPEDILLEGERVFEHHAPRLGECIRTGRFPRAMANIVKLEAPGWMKRRAENTVSP